MSSQLVASLLPESPGFILDVSSQLADRKLLSKKAALQRILDACFLDKQYNLPVKQAKKRQAKQTSKAFMRSKAWSQLRQQALERDQHECYLCKAKEQLCVHHLRYRRFDKALQDKDWNLVTLCQRCHWLVHKSSGNLDLAAKLSEERPDQWKHVIERC